MNQKPRKMGFWELREGKFAIDVQSAFEEIQKVCFDKNKKTEMAITIICHPPEEKEGKYGKMAYTVKKKLPSVESIKFHTELNRDGLVIADGKSPIDVIQEELIFKEINIKQIIGA